MTVDSNKLNPPLLVDQERQLRVSVIDTEDSFDGMEEVWKALVEEAQVTIFQTYEWQRTWWKYLGGNRKLYILVGTDGGRIIGILPLFKQSVNFLGVKVATWLRYIGTGLSDYLEPIIMPGYEESFVRVVLEHLDRNRKHWDIFEMSDVNVFTPLSRELVDRLRNTSCSVREYQGTLCSHVPLPQTWDGFLQQLGRHARHELKRKTEKLMENFKFEVEKFGEQVTDVGAAVETFASIHGGRWKGLGYESAFDNPEHLDFHIQVAEKFASRGWLQIYFLKLNGKRVAVNFSFVFHNRIYVYQANANGSGEAMRYSPGYVLHSQAIKKGIEEGAQIYDMLRGKEAYKYKDFKCVQTSNTMARIYYPSASGNIRFRLFILLEFARKVPIRVNREYHEFKRYLITEKPSSAMMFKFLGNKIKDLAKFGVSYFSKSLSRSAKPVKEDSRQE